VSSAREINVTHHRSAWRHRDRAGQETIPPANRNFANIACLVPGTKPVEPSDPTKARITAVSFGGSSGLNDVLSVDSADNLDDYIGGFLQNFSPDAIQEFAVQTSQQNSDSGRTVGGSVVITQSAVRPVARRCGLLRARRGTGRALSDLRIPHPCPNRHSRGKTTLERRAFRFGLTIPRG
jgi:hypothetical protein